MSKARGRKKKLTAARERAIIAAADDRRESKVIAGCVRYLSLVEGASAAFRADPTGDSDHAQPLALSLLAEAQELLPTIIHHGATKVPALRSTAAVALHLISDTLQGKALSLDETTFLRLFLQNVTAHLREAS